MRTSGELVISAITNKYHELDFSVIPQYPITKRTMRCRYSKDNVRIGVISWFQDKLLITHLLFQAGKFKHQLQKLFGLFKSTYPGVKDLKASVIVNFDTYKVRSPDLSQALMNGKIAV